MWVTPWRGDTVQAIKSDSDSDSDEQKRSPGFSGKNRGVTPSVVAPGVTHPSDATGQLYDQWSAMTTGVRSLRVLRKTDRSCKLATGRGQRFRPTCWRRSREEDVGSLQYSDAWTSRLIGYCRPPHSLPHLKASLATYDTFIIST